MNMNKMKIEICDYLLIILIVSLLIQFCIRNDITSNIYPHKWASNEEMIINEIKEQGGTETHLIIAECESQYGKYPYNWEGSSAKGVYQFTDETWNNYCEGDVMNYKDNIKCFIKLYPQHPSWWKCN